MRSQQYAKLLIIPLSLSVFDCHQNTEAPGKHTPLVDSQPENDGHSTYSLQNFTNAEWLYENYFGEYGLPDSFHEAATVELQKLANGFALTHAQGGDLTKAIGMFDLFARSMLDEALAERAAMFAEPAEQEVAPPSATPIPVTAAQPITAIPDPDFQNYVREQERLVREYDLPYPLPLSPNKILTVEQMLTMKDKENTNCIDIGAGKCPQDANPWGQYNNSGILSWGWHSHIIMVHGPSSLKWLDRSLQGYWRHAGIVIKNELGSNSIIDAMPDNSERVTRAGIDYALWDRYVHSYQSVAAFAVPAIYFIPDGPLRVANYARSLVGLPYRYLATKRDVHNRGGYCSVMLWDCFFYAAGIDIDADGGMVVLPDDIEASPNVMKVAQWGQ